MPPKTRIRTNKSKTSPNNRAKKQGRLPQASSVTASSTSSPPSTPENGRSSPSPSIGSDASGMEDLCTTEVLPPLPATQADESSESSEDAILSGTAKRLSFAHLLQASAPSRPGPRPVSTSSQRSSTLPSRPTGVSFHSSLSSNASRPSETCRFDVKLQVEPSKNTFQEVRRTALDFFSFLTEADSKVKLHPWDP